MKISTKGRYALRMLTDMALHQAEGNITLKDVAQRQNISKKYADQIALQLSQAGILTAVRGHNGGYRLVREPEQYTLYQLLTIMEGPLSPVACLDQKPNQCSMSATCPTLPVWTGLEKTIREYLSNLTLQDLVSQYEALLPKTT